MLSADELKARDMTLIEYDVRLLRLLDSLPPRATYDDLLDEARKHGSLTSYFGTMLSVHYVLTERLGLAFGYVTVESRHDGNGWRFTLTDAGRAALHEWDATHPTPPAPQPPQQGKITWRPWLPILRRYSGNSRFQALPA